MVTGAVISETATVPATVKLMLAMVIEFEIVIEPLIVKLELPTVVSSCEAVVLNDKLLI